MIFEGCERDLELTDWSPRLAWRFAAMSAQAYRSCPVDNASLQWFWRADFCTRITNGSQSALILADDRDVVVAFEGSRRDADDWAANRDTVPERIATACQYVHRGFLTEYEKVSASLESEWFRSMIRGRRLHTCGHSQGGAVAEVAACHMRTSSCYTYGTPRVFCRSLEPHPATAAWYHWHSNDVVPHLPIGRRFTHKARLCYVHQRKGGVPEPSLWRLVLLKILSYYPGDTVNDHGIAAYAEALACE